MKLIRHTHAFRDWIIATKLLPRFPGAKELSYFSGTEAGHIRLPGACEAYLGNK